MGGSESVCGGRILVVDDDPGTRSLVAAALVSAGFEPVEATSGEEAVARAGTVDAAILDVNVPGLSGYEICRRIKTSKRPVPVVFLSGERTEWFDRVAGLMLGGDDYVVKPFAPDELVARLRTVLRRAAPTVSHRMRALTRRELEVLRLLARGLGQKKIADQLVISPKTVGTHIEHILEKLGVRSRSQAIALAYREEFVSAS